MAADLCGLVHCMLSPYGSEYGAAVVPEVRLSQNTQSSQYINSL